MSIRAAVPLVAILAACAEPPADGAGSRRASIGPGCGGCVPLAPPACTEGACMHGIDPCPGEACALPDLVIDEEALRQSIHFDEANFGADDCAVEEGCVGATGARRLLRFTLSVANEGEADLLVGDPARTALAEWSACHEHFHMAEFATYRLLAADGSVAARGHKQAFCLMDTEPRSGAGPAEARYTCEFQGISRGWSDAYGSGLDCQWVDVTGVPEGEYVLEVEVNGAGRYRERDRSNNVARVPVFIPADPSRCLPRPEVCHDGRDQDCDGAPDDDCPPLETNDDCARAWPLDGSGVWTGRIGPDTAGAGPSACGGAGGALHFRLNVLADEILLLSTIGSEIETVLRVEAGACGATAPVHCAAASCGVGNGRFVGTLAAGSYDVIVQAKERDAEGIVRLAVQRTGCADARPLEASGSYAGDTAGRPRTTMPGCGIGAGPEEVWYFATCPGATEVELSTCEASTFDSILELRRGSCRGPAAACNDDATAACAAAGGSRIARRIEEEALWFLFVDGYLAGDEGAYRLDARLVREP